MSAWLAVVGSGCALPAERGSGRDPAPASAASSSPSTAAEPAGSAEQHARPAPLDPMAIAGMGAEGIDPIADGSEAPVVAVVDELGCEATERWDPAWARVEAEVLALTNERRARGATCGALGTFPPAAPLAMQPNLRCAARLHAQDMGAAEYFAHDSLDGRDPFDRMQDAGYAGGSMGENIGKGQQTPAEVVQAWMDSDGHCANVMRAGFVDIGVGYWEGPDDNPHIDPNKLWTQDFGTPRVSSF